MIRRRFQPRVYYTISPSAHAAINAVANSIKPGEARNSFLLRVSAQLRLAAPVGGCPDELVQRCVDKVLAAFAEDAA